MKYCVFQPQGILIEYLEGRGHFNGVDGVSSAEGHSSGDGASEHVAQVRLFITYQYVGNHVVACRMCVTRVWVNPTPIQQISTEA